MRPITNQVMILFCKLPEGMPRNDCFHFLQLRNFCRTCRPLSDFFNFGSYHPKTTLRHLCVMSSTPVLIRSAAFMSQNTFCSKSATKESWRVTFQPHKPVKWHDKSFCSNTSLVSKWSILEGTVDRYQGIWVDLNIVNEEKQTLERLSEAEFDTLLKASLESWRSQGLTSAWLTVPVTLGKFLSVAYVYGFTIHHAEGDQVTLALWMGEAQESKIPRFATHQVGVSGLVINEDTREVLVVQDKNRPYQLWKFPGGLSDLGEDIAATAEREVFEETGLKTEFQSVLAFRQQHSHPGAFGRSDLYVLCRLKPITFDLHPCEEEIAACQWMSIDKLKEEVHASSLTHKLADVVLLGLERGFSHVDITSCEMASIYKGLKFHLFHRPLQQ